MKILFLFAFVLTAACEKKSDDTPKPAPAAAPKTAPKGTDRITVYGTHAEKKPDDPVEVKFEKFKVTRASFDPKNLEGGTATIEVDLASITTASAKRTAHLKSPDYIDLGKFATMTIDVSNVKKQDARYTADAKVGLRGIEKTYAVTFEVLEAGDTWVRIKGEHVFPRTDFGVGKPTPGPDESVAIDLAVQVELTLQKT